MRPEARIEQREQWAAGFVVHVGVDAGKSFHKLVASGRNRVRTKAVRVEATRAGFDGAVAFLQHAFPGVRPSETLVGIEFAGHYGYTFGEYLRGLGYQIVTVPSVVTKRLKEVEDNSPRKDDAKDAAQICKLLGSGYFVSYGVLAPAVGEMRVLTSEYHRLTREKTRLRNRLHSAMDLAFPEFAGFFSDIGKKTPLALLERWPLATDVAAASRRTVHSVMQQASLNHYKPEQIATFIESAKTSVAVGWGAEGRRAEIHRLLARWALLREQMAAIEARLAELVDAHPGAHALHSVPKVSVVCAATLIAELGTPESYESPRQVLKLAGMNLARKESGTSIHGRARQTKRGRPQLRRQLFLLAWRWCSGHGLYREEYLALVARNGGRKISALCAIARRLVPMLLHVVQTGEAFDEAKWRRQHHGRGESPYRAA